MQSDADDEQSVVLVAFNATISASRGFQKNRIMFLNDPTDVKKKHSVT